MYNIIISLVLRLFLFFLFETHARIHCLTKVSDLPLYLFQLFALQFITIALASMTFAPKQIVYMLS